MGAVDYRCTTSDGRVEVGCLRQQHRDREHAASQELSKEGQSIQHP